MANPRPFSVRRLEPADVPDVLRIISDCRREYGLANRLATLLEPSDHNLFETYQQRRSTYLVAVVNDEVVGGAGIARLADSDDSTCELQRMYLRQQRRGLGIGHALLAECLQAAGELQYRWCYAETISEMTAAIAFYERHGFQRLTAPMGRTGHNHNDYWMLMSLPDSIHAC
jgi:putative acetyltransferase